MKKLLLLTAVFLGGSIALAFPSGGITPSMVNDVQSFQGGFNHDMNSINQQRFRYEEVNDYKDLKEEKQRIENKTDTNVMDDSRTHKTIIKPPKNVRFIQENGEIRIEGDE